MVNEHGALGAALAQAARPLSLPVLVCANDASEQPLRGTTSRVRLRDSTSSHTAGGTRCPSVEAMAMAQVGRLRSHQRWLAGWLALRSH